VYDVTIKGTNVAQGPQPFALVVVGDVGYSVDHVAVAPAAIDTEVGTKVKLTATAYDASNKVVNGIPFLWNISSPSLGNVTKTAVNTADFNAATKVGTGSITTSAFGKTATATVNLKAGPLAQLKVTPGNFTLKIKETQSLTVEGADKYGNPLPLPSQIAWQVSSEINGSTVSGSGGSATFTAGTKAGNGKVIATGGGKSGEAKAQVQPGDIFRIGMKDVIVRILRSVNCSGFGFDEYNNPISGQTFNWALEDSSLGSLSPTSGENVTFTAGTKATIAKVKITMGSRTGGGNITITPGDPVGMMVDPKEVVMDPFTQVTLNAYTLDNYSNRIESLQIYWTLKPKDFGRLIGTSGSHVKFESTSVFGAEGDATAGFQSQSGKIHIKVNPSYLIFGVIALVIGLMIALMILRKLRKVKCPYCRAKVSKKAIACPSCCMPLGGPSFGGGPDLPMMGGQDKYGPPTEQYPPPGGYAPPQQYPPPGGYAQPPPQYPQQPPPGGYPQPQGAPPQPGYPPQPPQGQYPPPQP
jgi:hypothetical protein